MGFCARQSTKASERNFYQFVFALAVLALIVLPPRAEAVIRMGSANTVSLSNGLVGYWPLDGAVTNWGTGHNAQLPRAYRLHGSLHWRRTPTK
jgi:hypothetical protein